MSQLITLMNVKEALRDSRFRESLPKSFSKGLEEYLKNPGCACNLNFYKKIINEAQTELSNYFPGREIQPEKIKIPENNFVVINCHVNELEQRLNKLFPNGRKQMAVTRWEDQVTAVVNDLDLI